MAQSYEIPPWVRGVSAAEIGNLTAGRLRLQASVQEAQSRQLQQAQEAAQRFAMEQQRLAQEKEQTQMQMQLREKTLAQETERQRQQLEMTKAYHEQVTNLRQQDLEIGKQKAQQAAQKAAQSFAAQQAMQQEIGDASDPERTRRAVLKYGPMIGGMGGEMSTALRASEEMAHQPVKAIPVEGAPGYFQVPSPSGHGYTVRRNAPSDDDLRKMSPSQASSLSEHLPELAGVYGTNWVNDVAPLLKKRIQQGLEEKVAEAKSGGKKAPPVGTVIKGHRFKGGDPADKDNWEKVE